MAMYEGFVPSCFSVTYSPTAPAHHSTYGRELADAEYSDVPQRTARRDASAAAGRTVGSPALLLTQISNCPRNQSYEVPRRFHTATYPIGVLRGTRTDSQLPVSYVEAQSVS